MKPCPTLPTKLLDGPWENKSRPEFLGALTAELQNPQVLMGFEPMTTRLPSDETDLSTAHELFVTSREKWRKTATRLELVSTRRCNRSSMLPVNSLFPL